MTLTWGRGVGSGCGVRVWGRGVRLPGSRGIDSVHSPGEALAEGHCVIGLEKKLF